MIALRSARIVRTSCAKVAPSAFAYSTVLPSKDEKDKAEAARLAMQSMKDLGSMFSSGSDDATQPIDTAPIYQNPTLFSSLSLLHQGQVLAELQEKYDKKWTKLNDVDKKLGYYIAYGDWGVREKFKNWNTSEPPYDLPFTTPSKIKQTNPTGSTIIKKLEPVILGETDVRKSQFDVKKMDPVTKVFIYLSIFITMVAIARDKNTGESGKPVEVVIEDPYEKERLERQKKEEIKPKRWYYLWLK